MVQQDDDFSRLMLRISEGSEDAAWEIVTRYGEEIRRGARRVLNTKLRSKFDSLDFVQLVWKSFFRVRNKCNRFQRPEELAAFLAAMVRNKVGMENRRRLATQKYNVRQEWQFDELRGDGLTSRPHEPIDIAIAHEKWEQMLENQPEHYREILHLRLQGHTCREIGKSVGVTERTVRRFLKKLLDETTV